MAAQAAYVLACLPGLLILAVYAMDYFGHAWSIVTFPFGWDYGEAPELARAISVANGGPFYTSWSGPPYRMANYTPLFTLLNAAFVRVFGAQFQSGRAIAWGCGLLFSAGLAWLAWRAGRSLLAPLVTTLLWFSSQYVWNWTPLGRVDELAMLCSLVGFIVVYEGLTRPQEAAPTAARAAEPPGGRAIWWALPWFLAAIYARQTTIECALATALYLALRRPALAFQFTLVFAASAGAIFAALNLATHGAFALNVVTGNQNIFRLSSAIYQGKVFWTHYQGAMLLAAAYAALQIARRRQLLFALWLATTFAVAVTIGKDGAASNYGLLPWAAVSLAAGLAVGDGAYFTAQWWAARRARFAFRCLAVLPAFVVGFLLLLEAQLSFHLPYVGPWSNAVLARQPVDGPDRLIRQVAGGGWYLWLLPQEPPPTQLEREFGTWFKPSAGPANRVEQAQIDQLVAGTPGDVLDEDMTHVLLAGKRIYIQPFEFAEEALLGQWNPQPVVDAIAQQRFGLVILTKPLANVLQTERFTPPMVAALTANYCAAGRTINYYMYRPCGG